MVFWVNYECNVICLCRLYGCNVGDDDIVIIV